ncbi:MAG: nickel-dependent hydrogenase large subunit [Dissulfurispiraceae bacterium]|jgi:Ni,Fe-hydrogenase I large subunit|nr:nickel-dependent hydrogenase large subunit [Dissulfurispiraceae bacterium]
MARIVVDPITRIEGHLRIEAQVENGRITDAWAAGTMFRGIEIILKDRDPRDAWIFTQRICGVCTTTHALASVRAVENALNITIPSNANIIRNIIACSQLIQDHIVHFYHLHALDWVDVVSALKADPAKTSALAQSLSDWPLSSTSYFKGVQNKVKTLVESGQLGIFANGYWGHSAYKLPAEANLMAVAHYLEALDLQREFIRIHALLGSKNPHLQTYLVGGVSIPVDPNSQNALNADSIAFMLSLSKKAQDFVSKVYIPDLLAVASFYKDWAAYGGGSGNFISVGEFPSDGTLKNMWMPAGIIFNKDLSKVHPVDQSKITEYVTHSWYEYSGGDAKGKHPFEGETNHKYSGPKPPYDYLDTSKKYSWIKAPRYDDKPMEVGPLARVLVAYASGQKQFKDTVDAVLKKLGVGPEALFSTLGRTAARGIETLVLTEMLPQWIGELAANMKKGDYTIHSGDKWEPSTWPKEAKGWGFHEASRGFLGHWVNIKDKKTANYQCVVPTTWNASPRDAKGKRGPYEEALVGTPIADPNKPVEILRTIHSFDPCIACAVHLVDATGKEVSMIKVR